MIFVKDRKLALMAENPSTSFRDMMQLVAERWRALTPEEKYHYEKKAQIDKERHAREMEVWNNHLKENPAAANWKRVKKFSPV